MWSAHGSPGTPMEWLHARRPRSSSTTSAAAQTVAPKAASLETMASGKQSPTIAAAAGTDAAPAAAVTGQAAGATSIHATATSIVAGHIDSVNGDSGDHATSGTTVGAGGSRRRHVTLALMRPRTPAVQQPALEKLSSHDGASAPAAADAGVHSTTGAATEGNPAPLPVHFVGAAAWVIRYVTLSLWTTHWELTCILISSFDNSGVRSAPCSVRVCCCCLHRTLVVSCSAPSPPSPLRRSCCQYDP